MIETKNVPYSDCFTNQKFLLNCFGLLPNENVLRKVYTISLLILLTIYLFSVYPEILKDYYVDFSKFIFCFVIEIGRLSCLLCLYFIFWNRFKLQEVFEKLQLLDNLSNFNNAEGENDFIKQSKDLVRKQAYFGILWIIILQIVFVLISVILSLNKDTWILPFGRGSAIIINNNIQFIIETIVFGIISVIFILLIIIDINILTLICDHCKLLKKYIELSFTDHKGEIFMELDMPHIQKKVPDWKTFKVQLQHIVPYHVGIIDAANQMESVFSIVMLMVFGGLSICLCLTIYHTQLNIGMLETIKDVNLIFMAYTMLIIISIYGEKVATESSKIASVCYGLDFVGCDLRIQKSLILIMAISQRSITPTIGKWTGLGLRTMLSILRSIYTYYTILQNVMNE